MDVLFLLQRAEPLTINPSVTLSTAHLFALTIFVSVFGAPCRYICAVAAAPAINLPAAASEHDGWSPEDLAPRSPLRVPTTHHTFY